MTPNDHPAKNQSTPTGIFATLRALLRAQGTTAPTRAREGKTARLAPLTALALSALAFTATPALAHGILNRRTGDDS